MSEKVLDAHGRWRNITVAFRVSPEEDEQIERLVKLTGLTKQDYILNRQQVQLRFDAIRKRLLLHLKAF